MPNPSIRRLENSYMPPKKSAWRFNNIPPEHLSTESEHIDSVKESNHNMGLMSNNSEMKSVAKFPVYSIVEGFAQIKNEQSEDAPLDFSLKTGSISKNTTEATNRLISISKNATESMNHLIKPLENGELKENVMNYPTTHVVFPGQLNGSHFSPVLSNGSTTIQDNINVTSCGKDSDIEMDDCSDGSDKSSTHSLPSHINRFNGEVARSTSPEHPSLSNGNSPVGHQSILEGMLRSQKHQNIGMINRHQTFGNGYGNSLSLLDSQMLSNSPPMAGSVIHPANHMFSFPMGPYFGYGYVDHSSQFMPSYMYQAPESTISDTSFIRKSKRKVDPLTDPLKACSVDELRKKLSSVSAESTVRTNFNYAASTRLSCSPTGDFGRSLSQNVSPETVQNSISNVNMCTAFSQRETNNAAINHNNIHAISNNETNSTNIVPVNSKENNDASKISVNHNKSSSPSVAPINHNKTSNSSVSAINHDKTNSPCVPAINHTENISSVNVMVSHTESNDMKKEANFSSVDDTNDSVPSAITEPADGCRRKPESDYKKDPLYKLKRAKNNLAARRSRETRRVKEELIRQTATALEATNKILVRDLTTIKFSYDEMQVKYFTLLKEYDNMKIQNSVLVERLNQKRCGQCGTTLPNVN